MTLTAQKPAKKARVATPAVPENAAEFAKARFGPRAITLAKGYGTSTGWDFTHELLQEMNSAGGMVLSAKESQS